MNIPKIRTAAAVLSPLLLAPTLALAEPSAPATTLGSGSLLEAPAFTGPAILVTASDAGTSQFTAARHGEGPKLESIYYRPRRNYRPPPPRHETLHEDGGGPGGFSQFYGGFLDPDGNLTSNAVFGLRAGLDFDSNVQLGVGADWSHRSDRQSVLVTEVPLPGGGTAERRRELARSSSDLFPMMAVLQVRPGGNLPIAPYFGVGGGWEVLLLSAEDFESGSKFDAAYGGWGWQAWAGISLQLSGNTRLNGEVFRNTAEVHRDIEDPNGILRESVDMGGTGGRFGLSWGF